MNILVVCQYYYPEQFKINDICEQLASDGHVVTVLTGLPNYPTGKIPAAYKWGRKRKEFLGGVRILRTLEIGRKKGALGLLLNYASFMVSASFKALYMKMDFDAILVYQLSPVTMIFPGVVMKKRAKKPLLVYCCDIWPESMKNLIGDKENFLFMIAKKISRFLYAQCDGIMVTSKPFIEYIMNTHHIPAERIRYLPQHAEDLFFKTTVPSMNNIIDFVFLGNVGYAQNIGCIIDAAALLRDIKNFHIHIVGGGSCLEASIRASREKMLDGVITFYGQRPLPEMQKFYDLADACLLTLKADTLIGQTVPSKLQGYMAAGKPVIAAINGAAEEIIREAACGLCVTAGDAAALAAAMRVFIENPEKFKDCGENGRRYYQNHFTKSIFMGKLESELNKVVGVK